MTKLWSYLGLLFAVLMVCAVARFPNTIIAMGILATYTTIREKPALKRLVRIPIIIFVVLVLLSAFITPSFLGTVDLSTTSARSTHAIDLMIKGLMILLVIQIFATRISVSQLTNFTEKLGVKGFGFVLGVALHLLPALHRHARTSRRAMAIRGAFRKNRIQAEFRWVMAIMKWMLRQGDLICVSARLRGVDLTK